MEARRVATRKLESKVVEVIINSSLIFAIINKKFEQFLERIGFGNLELSILERRAFTRSKDGFEELIFSKELLNGTNERHDNVKNIMSLETLLAAKEGIVYKFKDKLFKFVGGDVVNIIVDNYDKFLDYPEFDETKWGKALADSHQNVSQIKGRIVKLTYNRVSSWEGDGHRSGDNNRAFTSDDVNTVYDIYREDIDSESEDAFIDFILNNSVLFEAIKMDSIKVNVKKVEEYLNKNSKKFVAALVADAKSNNESNYNKIVALINKVATTASVADENQVSEVREKITWYSYEIFSTSCKYRDVFEKYARSELTNELVEKFNQLIDEVEVTEIDLGRNRFYISIPKSVDSRNVELVNDSARVGAFIGKGGANIKEVGRILNRRLFIKR